MARFVHLTVWLLTCYVNTYAKASEGCEDWKLQPNDNIRSFKFTSGMSVHVGPLKDRNNNYRINLLQSGLTEYLLDFILTSNGMKLRFQRVFQPANFSYDLRFQREIMVLNFTEVREMWTLGVGFGNDVKFTDLDNISLDGVEALQLISQSKEPFSLQFCYPGCRNYEVPPSPEFTPFKFQPGITLGISTSKDIWSFYPFRICFRISGRTSWTLELNHRKGTFYMAFNDSIEHELFFYLHTDEILTMTFYSGREGSIVDVRKGEYHKALELKKVSLEDIDEVTVYQSTADSRQMLLCTPSLMGVAPRRVTPINPVEETESHATRPCLVSVPFLYVMPAVCVVSLLTLVFFVGRELRQLCKKRVKHQSVDEEELQVTRESATSSEQDHAYRDSCQRPMNNYEEYLAPKTSGRDSFIEMSYVVRAGEEDHVYFQICNSTK